MLACEHLHMNTNSVSTRRPEQTALFNHACTPFAWLHRSLTNRNNSMPRSLCPRSFLSSFLEMSDDQICSPLLMFVNRKVTGGDIIPSISSSLPSSTSSSSSPFHSWPHDVVSLSESGCAVLSQICCCSEAKKITGLSF